MNSASPWLALFAAVGIGTVIAAIVGWFGSKAVAISNHRQNWINALRDDLVTYLKEIDAAHYVAPKVGGSGGQPSTTEDVESLHDTRDAALLVYRRILLRLNMTEKLHIELAERLKDLLIVKNTTADSHRIDEVVILARQVLKYEWAVTKYGVFTTPILWIKTLWRLNRGLRICAYACFVALIIVGSIWLFRSWETSRALKREAESGINDRAGWEVVRESPIPNPQRMYQVSYAELARTKLFRNSTMSGRIRLMQEVDSFFAAVDEGSQREIVARLTTETRDAPEFELPDDATCAFDKAMVRSYAGHLVSPCRYTVDTASCPTLANPPVPPPGFVLEDYLRPCFTVRPVKSGDQY
jgi:hypothetical protein